MATQDKWHFCHKCFGMFYNGDQAGRRGHCPNGGGHEAYGFNFDLPHTYVSLPRWQGDWRFCEKCFGMFYGGDRDGRRGRCPSGGEHVEYGLIFGLPYDVAETPGTQQQWRFCHKCFGMFYNGDQQGRRGRCPAGGGHDAFGYNFVLPHTAEFVELPAAPPVPTRPTVSVAFSGEIANAKFHVTGAAFLPNRPANNQGVAIRVVDANALIETRREYTPSSSSGAVDHVIAGDLSGAVVNAAGFAVIAISATDGRPDAQDATGFLWSNTVRTNIWP